MVFCNVTFSNFNKNEKTVTILILIDGFLQYINGFFELLTVCIVTILILIDGFLQFNNYDCLDPVNYGHNPYFNRWFSAILIFTTKKEKKACHNPYFNRWFSAITFIEFEQYKKKMVTILILIDGFLQYNIKNQSVFYNKSHNPYFNRWFSAILWQDNI